MMRAIGVVLAAGLVGLGLPGCGDDGDGDASGVTTTTDGPATGGEPSTSGSTTAAPAAEAPLEGIEIAATPVAEVDSPTALVVRPGSPTMYVAERAGRVRPVTVTGAGRDRTYAVGDPVLDISADVVADGERGLLDIEFSDDGGTLYVHYSLAPSGDTRVAAYTMAGDDVDTGSYRELLAVEDPYPNHNGGEMEIGPDGFLYIALGDGGGGGDPEGNGQDTQALLGKILRIDPGQSDRRPGLRHSRRQPVRGRRAWAPRGVALRACATRGASASTAPPSDLWIGDVGQDQWEEIDLLPAAAGGGRGANLGWNEMEATHPFEGGSNPEGGVLPVFEYTHDEGCSVTGGVVYRGSAIPGLAGAYLFGDYCQGDVRALRVRDGQMTEDRTFDAHVDQLVSFAEDADGEVYALSLLGGIYRLDAAG